MTGRYVFLVTFGAVATLAAALVGCTSMDAQKEPLCTPNANVFCRCSDQSRGTKQCNAAGDGFGECSACKGGSTEVDDGNSGEGEEREGNPNPANSSGAPSGAPGSSGTSGNSSTTSSSSGSTVEPACGELGARCCDHMTGVEGSECRSFVNLNSEAQCVYWRDRYASFGKCG